MERTIHYKMDHQLQRQRLSGFLRTKGYSYHSIRQLRNDPVSVLINGIPAHMNQPVLYGDQITVHIVERESSPKIEPVYIPLDICYEDEDIIVINKPAGMPVHPSVDNYDNTLANALAYYYRQKGEAFVFRCTNRLDRDTSGLILVSKHYVAAGIIADEMKNHSMHREYRAIVKGSVTPCEGTIQAPIGRTGSSLVERGIDFEHGDPAVTHYRVVEERNGYSLVALNLETGRTHQIRVHMKYLGYPLIGDYLYHPVYDKMDRQALHSYRLQFLHPITGAPMEITKDLPPDMQWFYHDIL